MSQSQQYSVSLGLPIVPATANQDMFTELMKVYNAIRNLTANFDTITGAVSPDYSIQSELGVSRFSVGGMCKIYKEARVGIAYGQTVQLWDAGSGIAKAELGTDGKVIGYCSNTSGVTAGQICEITCFVGLIPNFPAGTLVPGNKYYQSGTAGSVGVSGVGLQCCGVAVSDTTLLFHTELS